MEAYDPLYSRFYGADNHVIGVQADGKRIYDNRPMDEDE